MAFAAAATAYLVVLHARYVTLAGPLWRDEANTEGLSRLSSFGELWANLQYDSFPLLWHALLRAFRVACPRPTESDLRILGGVVGLGLAAAIWVAARQLGNGPPVVSLPLLGLQAAVIAYGDSIRAYGLGMATGILAFALLWRLADSARRSAVLPALVASLAAVHCLFHNVVVVGAAVVAGVAVAARRRDWRNAATVAGIGVTAALSMVPYAAPIRQAGAWNDTVRAPVTVRSLLAKLNETIAMSGEPMSWIWALLVLLSLALAALAAVSPREGPTQTSRAERTLYAGVALAAAIAGYAAFLLLLSYPTQPWYYLALLGLAAACVETCLHGPLPAAVGEAARLALGVGIVLVAAQPAWQAAGTRRTNVDVLAARIEREARAEDLVVVSPWYLGVTFERHYRGAAPWVSVPPIGFFTFHRYDVVRLRMADPQAMEPVLREIRGRLERGRRIWWVGDSPPPRGPDAGAGRQAPLLTVPSAGRDASDYARWNAEAGALLASASTRPEPVRVDVRSPVDPYERALLWVIRSERPAAIPGAR